MLFCASDTALGYTERYTSKSPRINVRGLSPKAMQV